MQEYSFIAKYTVIIHKYFKQYLRNELKDTDMNAVEAMVILMLCRPGTQNDEFFNIVHNTNGRTQEQLVGKLHYDKSVMTRTMQSLEEKGYVTRNDHPTDCRSFVFTPTDKALEAFPRVRDIFESWDELLLSGIGDPELVSSAVRQMAENLENYFLKENPRG